MKKKRKQKTLQKTATAQVLLSKVSQKLDVKQNVKSLLLLAAFTISAIAGRVALQHVPSVESVTPFSILAGFILGPIYGFITGAAGFYTSNFFVWGGQGPWTIFQCLGAGLAGFIAGLMGKMWKGAKKISGKELSGFKLYMLAVVIGICVYELIVDIGGALIFYSFLGIPAYIVTSLPFSAAHLFSGIGFCAALWKFREKLPKFGGKIIEKTKLGFARVGGIGFAPSFFEREKYKTSGEEKELVSKFLWKKQDE